MSDAAAKECRFVLALGGTLRHAEEARYCGVLTTTGSGFYDGALSFVVPKDSPLTEPFNRATLALRNQDAIPTIEEYLNRDGVCENISPPVLDFKKLQIFFYLAFGSCVLIFIEMIVDPQAALKSDQNGEQEDVEEEKAARSSALAVTDALDSEDGIDTQTRPQT